MDAKKPLLIIEPLTPSLLKLKQALIETAVASEENFEIYDVSTIAEAISLIPTIGPSLTITSSAKQAALILQADRPIMRAMKSKMMLVNPTPLPPQLATKLQKMGLTELIVEPIAPKSLLFKVKFFMRSLPSQSKLEEASRAEKESVKKIKISREEAGEINSEEKQRIEKGVMLDKYMGRENSADKFKDINLNIVDDSAEVAEKKGKVSVGDFEESIEVKTKKERRLDIEIDIDVGNKKKKEKDEEETSEPLVPRKVKSTNLDIENDNESLYDKRKREKNEETQLDNENQKVKANDDLLLLMADEDKVKKLKKDEEITDQISLREKPDLAPLVFEEENPKEKRSQKEINLDDANRLLMDFDSLQLDIEDDDVVEKNSGETKLEFEPEETTLDLEESNNLLITEDDKIKKRKKASTELELIQDDLKLKRIKEEVSLDLSDEKAKKKFDEQLIEDIKLERKKNLKETDLEFDLSDETKIKKGQEELIIEDDFIKKTKSKINQLEDLDLSIDEDLETKLEITEEYEKIRKNSEKLVFEEEDLLKKSKNIDEEENGEDIYDIKRTKNNKLELEESVEEKEKKLKSGNDDSEESLSIKDHSTKIEMEEELLKEAKKKRQAEEDLNAELLLKKNKKIDLGFEAEIDDKEKEAKNNREIIETKWINKKYRKEVNWDELFNKKKDQYLDLDRKLKQKNGDDETFYLKRKNLGEQTIDYRTMKKEYDEAGDKILAQYKNTRPENQYDSRELILANMQPVESLDIENTFFEEMMEEKDPIFTPKSNGIEYAISTLNFYLKNDQAPNEILKFLAQTIYTETRGMVAFYYQTNNLKPEEAYLGHLFLDDTLPENSRRTSFDIIRDERLATWLEKTLPSWKDETFQASDQEYIYPFFEGITRMGFAVVHFKNGIKEEKSKIVETILESSRSIFLNRLHQAGKRGKYNEEEEKKNKVVGFFTKMFGKKAS